MLSSQNLQGIWATTLLPINSDDSINYKLFESALDIIGSSGVSGIYTNGTAGEFYNQEPAEFDLIQQITATKCKNYGLLFQIGASNSNPTIALSNIRRTLSLNPDAYQITLPDWLPLTDDEQIEFFKKMAQEAGSIPLVLYNPGHSKAVLTPSDFTRLQEAIPELIGIKVAAKGADWLEQMKSVNRLSVFIQGHRLATGISSGIARGSYSNIACFNPAGAMRWYQMMKENIKEALEVEKQLVLFFDQCIIPFAKAGYSDPALDKLLAFAGGCFELGTRLRWPYKWIPEAEALTVRKKARQILPSLLIKL